MKDKGHKAGLGEGKRELQLLARSFSERGPLELVGRRWPARLSVTGRGLFEQRETGQSISAAEADTQGHVTSADCLLTALPTAGRQALP